MRIFTDDPSELPDWYLDEVEQRISNGTADINDYNLQDEIISRKKARRANPTFDSSKPTFTPLNNREIDAFKKLLTPELGQKAIEKIKTGSGDSAGKFDLFKNDKSGDIVVLPKNGPQDGDASPTGYNINDLDL